MATDKSLILNYHVGGFKQPRLSDGISHPCTSIKADGTVTVFTTRKRSTATARVATSKRDHTAQYARLLSLGAIGNTQ